MLGILIFLIYFLLVYFSYRSLKKTKLLNLSFSGGVLIGLIYFLAIPLFFILIIPDLHDPGIFVSSYNPYEDIKTTLNLYLGWVVVLIAQNSENHSMKNKSNDNTMDFNRYYLNPVKIVWTLLGFYLFISLYNGISTGMFSDGRHWHDSTRNDGALFIIMNNFANTYRVTFFGCVLYLLERGLFNRKNAILLVLALTMYDVFVSFNRITAVYFIIFNVIVFRKNILILIALAIPFIPLLVHVSSVWTWFRGAASVGGYSISGFIQTWQDVSDRYEAAAGGFIYQLNSIFESSNILVFHGIVENVGGMIPVFYGKTFIIRPLTTFIPSSIWTDKPKVFGVYMGEYINGMSGLALNSTLFGEAYANFLYLWPVLLLCALLGFSWVYRRLSFYMPCLSTMSIFIGISLWRFDMNFTVASLYSLVAISVFVKVVLGRKLVWGK